jgi:hypothetical protein
MTIEERLRKLEAHRSIEELIVDLSRAFDGGPSAEKLRPLFADDGRFEIDQYGTIEGADQIAAGVVGNADQGFAWTLHYLVSPKIILAADAASADADFMLWEVATSASGKAYLVGGRYVAQVKEGADGWQFTLLRLEADLISHYPPGWIDKPETLADA